MKEPVWDITDRQGLELAVQDVVTDELNSDNNGARVLALSGNLGAGKTTLVQDLARQLGVKETVTSPTFVIMKRYDLPEGQRFDTLIHIDAYRVESPEELEILGLPEDLANPRNLICIEWAEKIPTLIPSSATKLSLALTGEKRQMTLEN